MPAPAPCSSPSLPLFDGTGVTFTEKAPGALRPRRSQPEPAISPPPSLSLSLSSSSSFDSQVRKDYALPYLTRLCFLFFYFYGFFGFYFFFYSYPFLLFDYLPIPTFRNYTRRCTSISNHNVYIPHFT